MYTEIVKEKIKINMAIKYNGLIRFSSALKPTGPQPLDDRTVVEYTSDLTNIDTLLTNVEFASFAIVPCSVNWFIIVFELLLLIKIKIYKV